MLGIDSTERCLGVTHLLEMTVLPLRSTTTDTPTGLSAGPADVADPADSVRDTTTKRDLQAAMAGDRAARATLVRGFQDVWYRFCLARLRDPHAARDATQETALRFIGTLDRFAGRSTLQTWSLGIALNVCREASRRRARDATNRDAVIESAAPTQRSHTPAADARLDLLDAIATLPARQAEAVTLRHLQGLSTREAAQAMGCAEGTVKATLSHAIAALRTHFHDTPDSEVPHD